MDIQTEVLEKLVCDYCGEYLSIGPVMLLEEEKSVCGRCHAPDPKEQTVLRNLPYELLAKDFLFPCQNKRHGCTVKRQFNSLKSHETTCEFRQFTCFLLETGSCAWFGMKKYILDHCKVKHPDLVVENPVILQHNVEQQSVKNFLMAAFNLLFVIHTKVCLQTKKIYHCVRLLGDAGHENYRYTLKQNKMSKIGEVSPQGFRSINESEFMAVDINGSYKETTFELIVDTIRKEPNNIEELSCKTCKKLITSELAYFDDENWSCENCVNKKHVCLCNWMGCAFTSTYIKSQIHSIYYCNYISKCFICKSKFDGTLDAHYDIHHNDITHLVGVGFIERISRINYKHLIIISDIGKMHFSHIFKNSHFQYSLRSTLDSGELQYYALELEFMNQYSGYSYHEKIPMCDYKHSSDWGAMIPQNHIEKCFIGDKCILKLTIKKF